jgi:hypothetical protein
MKRTINVGSLAIAFIAGLAGGALVNNTLKPDPHSLMLVIVMIVGGLLGGGVNYFLSKADDPENTSVTKSLFIGVGASLLVPLFLNMLSSDLLDSSKAFPYRTLVFLGFCLIAAISSKAFITTLSDKVLKEARQAKQEAAEAKTVAENVTSAIAPIVSKETEPTGGNDDDDDNDEMNLMEEAAKAPALEDFEKEVLRALGSSRYTLRSTGGVIRDTKAGSSARVLDALNKLIAKDMAGVRQGKNGELWYLTTAGRKMLTKI